MGRKIIPYAKEELKASKPQILINLKAGIPMRRMVESLNKPMGFIQKVRDLLVADGVITQDEIDEAHKKYISEHPAARGLAGDKVYERFNTEKAEARHDKSIERKEQVYELILQKMVTAAIAREIHVSEATVKRFRDELIAEGRIKEEDVNKSDGHDVYTIDRTSEEYLKNIQIVEEYLRKGWKNDAIKKKFNIFPSDFTIYINDLKRKGILTSEDIDKARTEKYERDLIFVAEQVNLGNSIDYVREQREEFTYNEVTPMLKELIARGAITKEQIDTNARNARRKKINKDKKMTPDEQEDYIFEKVKDGYAPAEILESDISKSLTMYKVLYLKRKVIAKGRISQKDADEAMEKRRLALLKEKHAEHLIQIRELFELGYTLEEIPEKIGFSSSYVNDIVSECKAEGTWYTEEQTKEFRRKRFFRELEADPVKKAEYIKKQEEKVRVAEEKAKAKERALTEKNEEYQKRLEVLRQCAEEGLTIREAGERIHKSPPTVLKYIREFKKDGKWFSDEEIKKFRADRKKRYNENNPEKQAKEERKKIVQDEINERRQKRQKKQQAEIKKMLEYVKSGYNLVEIAPIMNKKYDQILYLKKIYTKDNKWFTSEELRKFINERTIRERENDPIKKAQYLKEQEDERKKEEARVQRQKEVHQRREKRLEEIKQKQEQRQKEREQKRLERLLAEQRKQSERESRREEKQRKHEILLNKIISYAKKGFSLQEIADEMSLSLSRINCLKKEIAQNGKWPSKKKLEKYKRERFSRELDLDPEMKSDYFKSGDAQKFLGELKKAKIQEEKLKRAKNREIENQEQHEKDIEKLIDFTKQGLIMTEIAEKMHFSLPYIFDIKKELIENKRWFTKDELESFRRQRFFRELEADPEMKSKYFKSRKARKYLKEVNKPKIAEEKRLEAETLREEKTNSIIEYTELGFSPKEIGKKIHSSLSSIYVLIRELKANGDWYDEKQIQRFKNRRVKREEEEKRAKEREEKRQKRSEELAQKEEQRERKRAFQKLKNDYVKYKKKATAEEGKEADGEENVTYAGREEFVKVLIKLNKMGVKIPSKDIELVMNSFYLHPQMANAKILRFLISNSAKTGGPNSAYETINELINYLRSTQYHEPLVEYGRWMRKLMLIPRIKKMQEQGFDSNQIAEDVGISTAELYNLMDKNRKVKFFPDEPE